MKAVVLAAGEGTRLRPLTRTRPKPMLPIGNQPLLEHVLEAAREAGIDEFVFVVGYKRERIQSHFGDGDDWDVDIEYAVQETQLGTGHALLQAESYVDGNFLALNGDRIIEPTAISAVIDERRETRQPVMAVTRHRNPENYGVVELDGKSVRSIEEKPPAHTVRTDYINAGVYGLGESIFDALRETDTEGELAITAVLREHRDALRPIRFDGLWLDVSYHWDILSVNSRMLDRLDNGGSSSGSAETAAVHDRATVVDGTALGSDVRVWPGATVLPGTSLGDNVEVGSNAVVANSVVLTDATIGDGAVVRDCVVGENATVGSNTTIEGGEADVVVDGSVHGDVRLGGVLGDNAQLGGAVTVSPGTVLGNHASVESGAVVAGWIETDAVVRRG
ncbi:bifunctional sugar-1-phosphate nucleotidylyltransferase/acetyltransferase [Halobellus marinus]|uniref:bifunctional sugar-1-phosphate nucleotidylyltransferase/acetyltransferase n=1 Tax=Halobellus TaxID=1073986 RepID=UPI0028A65BD9|nr:bifunctional sugar-1-phosphate nucleotidylyltransferase/acetyltransferase [Halobellus sp. DFY28]